MTSTLLVAGVTGLLALDTRAVGRFLLGEPLFVGTIIGIVLGDPMTGLSLGAWFQLLWIHLLPEGAVTPPDGSVPTATAVALVVGLTPRVALPPQALVMVVMVLTIPLGFVSRWLEIHLKDWFARLSEWVDVYAYHGQTLSIARVVGLAVWAEWMKAAGLTAVAVGAGMAVLPRIIASLPQPMCDGLALSYWFIIPLGLAVMLELMNVPNKFRLFLLSFLGISLAYGMFQAARPLLFTGAMAIGLLYVRWVHRPRKLLV